MRITKHIKCGVKMNRLYLILASFVYFSFFSSCNKSEIDNHGLYVLYPSTNKILYADQVNDSLVFQTFDSYEVIPYKSDWITVTAGASYSVNYDPRKLYTFTTLLEFTQNTTGITRVGSVKIDSYEYSSAGVYFQLGFSDITHPAPKYSDPTQVIPESASFEMDVDATSEEDSICFTVSQPWTLDFEENADRTWATIDKVAGQKGYNKVSVTFTPNTDMVNMRSTAFILKCGDVKNLIKITQLSASQIN